MDFTPEKISAFRYWIQGYPNFYEPIVEEYFKVSGYRVLRRPALVQKRDIQHIIDALFDGHKRLGADLDAGTIRQYLQGRSRLQPDFLLEYQGKQYLAELKSWGGYRSGKFDLTTAHAEFVKNYKQGVFFLVDRLENMPIAGKILVVSSRSEEHNQALSSLQDAYQTDVTLLYLDELFATPQLQGFIEQQLHYLDAAVAELKQSLTRQR